MTKWIRWQGLAAFVVLSALVAGLWFFFIDNFVASQIEKYGARAVGAKVEVGSADVSLFPMGLRLDNMKVANPNAPMTNAFEFEHAEMGIDPGRLLLRQVIIEEMSLQGLKFDTTREKSGAIAEREEEKPEDEGKDIFSFLAVDIPDVSEILEREKLKTLTEARDLQNDIEEAENTWEKRIETLPDKEKLEEYEKRVETLKKSQDKGIGGMLGKASEAAALQKDISKDLENIRQAAEEFRKQMTELRSRMEKVTSMPAADAGRLREKYGFTTKGAGNYTRLLFGDAVGDYLETALYWYGKVVPLLTRDKPPEQAAPEAVKVRAEGRDIRYPVKDPLPGFLIRTLQADVSIDAGDLSGTVRNITNAQHILGKPLTFEFAGEKLQAARAVAFNGSLDHSSADTRDTLAFKFEDYQLQDITLSDSQKLPLTIEKAKSDLNGRLELKNNQLDATASAVMKNVNFGGLSQSSGTLADSLKTALSEVSGFKLTAGAEGTIEDYTLKIDSDLDKILQNVLGKVVQKQSARFEEELRKGIAAKVDGPLKDLKKEFDGLELIDTKIQERLKTAIDLQKGLKIF